MIYMLQCSDLGERLPLQKCTLSDLISLLSGFYWQLLHMYILAGWCCCMGLYETHKT